MSHQHNDSLKITGGTLFDGSGTETDNPGLLVRNGRIEALGSAAVSASADREFDASGCVIAPGFIDLCCNLREPGNGQKGNIASETRAAAMVASPPCVPRRKPRRLTTSAVTHLIREGADSRGSVRVLPVGAITRGLDGEMLSDMAGLKNAGCVAVGNGSRGVRNARILRRCMAYAQTFGLTVMFSPENQALAADGYSHDGQVATRLGLLGIPEVAETAAVMEMLLLAEETGVKLHLSQLSSGRSVQMLADARKRGIQVTADVAMHQLSFTKRLGPVLTAVSTCACRCAQADRQALVAGVRDGVIDAIVSQHQFHDKLPSRHRCRLPSRTRIESVLSLGLELVARGELERARLLSALTAGPASVLGRNARLAEGEAADLCVFAPEQPWQPSVQTLVSAGRHAPVLDRELPGRVRLTLVAGRTAWADPA